VDTDLIEYRAGAIADDADIADILDFDNTGGGIATAADRGGVADRDGARYADNDRRTVRRTAAQCLMNLGTGAGIDSRTARAAGRAAVLRRVAYLTETTTRGGSGGAARRRARRRTAAGR
jgi:hypothetical protein